LLAGMQQRQQHQAARMKISSFRQILERMRAWFQGNF
jgi:cell division protein FtsA